MLPPQQQEPYPDGCTRGEAVFDPETEQLLVQVPPLPSEQLYPKEQALLDLVAAERLAGRRVLVYATHTGTRDITGRMEEFLGRHGLRVAVMKADAVPPERREAWVAQRVEEGVDVLVCHPRLVQTGLDLVAFQTLCSDCRRAAIPSVQESSDFVSPAASLWRMRGRRSRVQAHRWPGRRH